MMHAALDSSNAERTLEVERRMRTFFFNKRCVGAMKKLG